MDWLLFPHLLSFRDHSKDSSQQRHFFSQDDIAQRRDSYDKGSISIDTANSTVLLLGSTYPSKSGPRQRATRPLITTKLEFSLRLQSFINFSPSSILIRVWTRRDFTSSSNRDRHFSSFLFLTRTCHFPSYLISTITSSRPWRNFSFCAYSVCCDRTTLFCKPRERRNPFHSGFPLAICRTLVTSLSLSHLFM